jgi:hypothetical protein
MKISKAGKWRHAFGNASKKQNVFTDASNVGPFDGMDQAWPCSCNFN